MHVPVQVDYGVRALVDLAQHSDETVVRASEIARRQGIPEQYLARVLHSLPAARSHEGAARAVGRAFSGETALRDYDGSRHELPGRSGRAGGVSRRRRELRAVVVLRTAVGVAGSRRGYVESA